MKRLLCALMLLFPISTYAAEQTPTTAAEKKPVLRIGTECTYPPFSFRNAEGIIQGFEVDIAKEMAMRAGYEPEIVCNPFDSSIPSLQARKFDILFTDLAITDERLKMVDFSIPYRSATARFAGAQSFAIDPFTADGKPNPEALKGKTVGIQRSSTYDSYVEKEFPGVSIRRYDTVNNMVMDLKTGRTDLIIAGPVEIWSALLEKEDGDKFKFVGKEIEASQYFGTGIAAAVRKGDSQLLEKANKALQSLYDDGTFKAINQKYWSFTVLPGVWQ